MQLQPLMSIGGLFAILYMLVVFGISIYVLILFVRFVKAHERVAGALEVIARKMRDQERG